MSNLLPGATRHELAQHKLLPRAARAAVGIGERRSRDVGAGLEFADFRPYEPGDDLRYLDRHVHARLGQHVVRQYALDKQLEMTLLLDGSGSMTVNDGAKFRMACELASALCYVALRSGDRVALTAGIAGRFFRHPVLTAESGMGQALSWIGRLEPSGTVSLSRFSGSARQLAAAGLLVVVSDFLTDDARSALSVWGRTWSEVIALQVLHPTEVEPVFMEAGTVVVDYETGDEVMVDGESLPSRYASAMKMWNDELAATVRSFGGQWYSFTSNRLVPEALGELRRGRLIG